MTTGSGAGAMAGQDPWGRQAAFNASSRDQWAGFEGHRRRVSALLGAGLAPASTRLCVLGAGNGNDLDLSALLRAHREVHLVDLDPAALADGVARQGVADRPSLRRFGGLDLTGLLGAIAGWSPQATIGPADLAALVDWPSTRVGLALPGPYGLVASTCLLSQLIGNASVSAGEGHPRFADLVRSIRLGHLRLLTRLVAPGGSAVLVTDVISSDALPVLATVTEPELPGLLDRLTRAGGLIHGVNPADILAVLRRDPVLAARVVDLEPVPPWLWRLHARSYLVWAVVCRVGPRA